MENEKKLGGKLEWNGQEVIIGPSGLFHCDLLFDSYKEFQSICEAIDRKLKALEKVSRKKLALPIYDFHGNEGVLTGIHATHGTRLTTLKLSSFGNHDLFPKHPKPAAMLTELNNLEKRKNELLAALRPLKLQDDGYHNRRMDLDDRYEAMELDYQNKLALCEKLLSEVADER